MADFQISPEFAEAAFTSPRYEVLGRLRTDIATVATWDNRLSRRHRILVPIDVQAYVVPETAPEETVDVKGDISSDPRPFAAGAAREAGVHLHWAMPDSLLVADHDPETRTPTLRALPDQWVVVRTVQPNGQRQLLATGWVIDARTQSLTPLPSYTGPVSLHVENTESPRRIDGFTFGVEWAASYAAAKGRFTFHDPLDLESLASLAPAGFHGDQAVYTVAGWWSDESLDPLTGARGAAALDSVLGALRWHVEHDADDVVHQPTDVRVTRLMRQSGLDSPNETTLAQVFGSDGRKVSGILEGVELDAAYPVSKVDRVWLGETLPRYHALLHGSVMGVPVGASIPPADDRPDPDQLTVALGSDVDDVVAALGADGIGLPEEERRAAEDLLAAFSSGLVAELGTPDGLDSLANREHESGFWSLPGTQVPAARPDRLRREDSLAANPLTVGRKGRAAGADESEGLSKLGWRTKTDLYVKATRTGRPNPRTERVTAETRPEPTPREVARPAPRFFRPAPFVLAVRNARPHHRHHGDGLYDDEGRLLCRYPSAAVPALEGLVTGAQILPTLGSGAIPAELTKVVREAALLNPYGRGWLVDAYAPDSGLKTAVSNRLDAEMVRLYGPDGRYDGTSHIAFPEPHAAPSAWGEVVSRRLDLERKLSAALADVAIVVGQQPSPVALTTWRQPWIPLWLEWRVTLTGSSTLEGWRLEGHDLERDPDATVTEDITSTLEGRSILGHGVGETLRHAVLAWAASERSRQATSGRTSHGDGTVVQRLADFNRPLDLVSASLDGIREQLLGIDYVGTVRRQDGKPVASGEPMTLFGGQLRVEALRIVDAFGRTVSVPDAVLDAMRSTLELEVEDEQRSVTMRPRLQNAARWLFRLVDPGQDASTPAAEVREAYVDQVSPDDAVNPVAGFLLPDHIDEGLEAFTVAGSPIGQLAHDTISGAVNWEPAPGRSVPPDAGPLVDLGAQERLVGEIAAGMVRADAAARDLPDPPEASALVTFLRAVDTTLWTVDAFASLGSDTLAGLVGRPVAVVRAIISLDAPDDVPEVTITAAGGAIARRAAYDALVEEDVEIQLGTLTRSDDTLLGFYLDDDYERVHLVDRVVAEHARKTGRHIGHLGLLGVDAPPVVEPLDHPYISTESRIRLRRGQTRRLTLLMLPGGRVHLTSGILPRKELRLADSWFTPGLQRLMPSVRVGPVLVDPGEIRLPLVSVLGERQTFTRRTGELAWKDDAILAATQTAYLPRLPHEIQEGWIRVTPPGGSG